jgi:hypothetical protein
MRPKLSDPEFLGLAEVVPGTPKAPWIPVDGVGRGKPLGRFQSNWASLKPAAMANPRVRRLSNQRARFGSVVAGEHLQLAA